MKYGKEFSLFSKKLKSYDPELFSDEQEDKNFISIVDCENMTFILFHASEHGIIYNYDRLKMYIEILGNRQLICCYPKKVSENYPELSYLIPDELKNIDDKICVGVGVDGYNDFTFYIFTEKSAKKISRILTWN